MTIFRLASALCALALLMTAPAGAEVRTFGNAVSLAKVPGLSLTPKQRRGYKKFSGKKFYFGAFFVVPETDLYFWTRNFHDLASAKAAANKGCKVISKRNNADGTPHKCQLYAVVYPKGVDPNQPGLSGLSQSAGKAFGKSYPSKQKPGKYGAFAINGANGFGFSFGWSSLAEAKETALAYCQVDSARGMANLGIEGRNWVKKNKLDRCRVIHVHKP